MSQSKIFWQTFQSRWVYLEIINQSIPTGFIFVKIYCYELFVCLCYCAPASYRPYSSHLSTSAGPRYSVCFVRSRTFVPRISWFVILIHFYCANESKDIAMHCCGGKGKKIHTEKNRFEATNGSLSFVCRRNFKGPPTKGEQIWIEEEVEQEKKPTDEIKHDINK